MNNPKIVNTINTNNAINTNNTNINNSNTNINTISNTNTHNNNPISYQGYPSKTINKQTTYQNTKV